MALGVTVLNITEDSLDSDTITTATFNVQAGAKVWVLSSRTGAAAGKVATCTASAGLTFVKIIEGNAQEVPASIFRAPAASALTGITVTVTWTGTGFLGRQVTVVEVTGEEDTYGGAAGSASGDPGTATVSVTTTRANSHVFACMGDWAAIGAPTSYNGGAGTEFNGHHIAAEVSEATWRTTNVVATPAATTSSVNATTRDFNIVAAEVREPAAAAARPLRPMLVGQAVSRAAIW